MLAQRSMRSMVLQLPSELSRRIEQAAARAYPDECCGFLFGKDAGDRRIVNRVAPAENVYEAEQRNHRFSIDPRELMQADRDAEQRGEVVLGFYHSHPDQPARPSEFDRQNAWPFYSYVIVSVAKGQTLDMTSWVLDEDTRLFQRQEIEET